MWKQEQFAWLAEHRKNFYSQWGEDGILAAIFERIGTANRWCCECGAADGIFFSNTRKLIEEGWSSLQIEADEASFKKLHTLYSGVMPGSQFVYVYGDRIDAQEKTLDRALNSCHAPKDIDLLVIDVDGQDYWLFNSLVKYRPRVVMVEYDPAASRNFIPPQDRGVGQAGLHAIINLGIGKYYWPVAITSTNVIFVQQELCGMLADEVDSVGRQSALVPAADHQIKVAAVMSTPRVGPLATMDAVFQGIARFNIPLLRGEGAFWHHSLTRGIEQALKGGAELILTVDYDTVFTTGQTDNAVAKLVVLMEDNPAVDVIVAAQMKREGGPLLATTDVEVALLDPLIPITQGHFGLTIFRASVFDRVPKPWLRDFPNEHGEWNENRIDADIHFWRQCVEHKINVQMSLDVLIGHLEWVVTWPGQDLRPFYQPLNDWRKNGKPPEAFDRQRVIAAVRSNPALLYGVKAKMEMGG